jgi:hypothetical protein
MINSVMDKEERIALLNKFFRQLLSTAIESIESMDRLKLGISEEEGVVCLLENFKQAVAISEEVDRYVTDAKLASERTIDDAPEPKVVWPSQDDSFGMK